MVVVGCSVMRVGGRMEAAKQKLIAPGVGGGLTRVSKSNQIYISLLRKPCLHNCVKIPRVEREAPF